MRPADTKLEILAAGVIPNLVFCWFELRKITVPASV
jgi:hypothetical protein